jgi:PTS system mannose-specific IIB component
MRNIVLCRIDDRLIHGQVVTSWVKQTNANRIVIVDNPLKKDSFMQKILRAAAPSNIKVDVLDEEEGINFLKEDSPEGEKVLILVKVPEILEVLIDGGVELQKIILGGMGSKSGRKKFNKNVSASQEEVETMRRIIKKGSSIYFQLVPTEKATDVQKLLKL